MTSQSDSTALLSRFLDRIGVPRDAQTALKHQSRIHSIDVFMLSLRMGIDLGAPTKRLIVGLEYMASVKKQLSAPLPLAVDRCITSKWPSEYSWEMFLMKRWKKSHIPRPNVASITHDAASLVDPSSSGRCESDMNIGSDPLELKDTLREEDSQARPPLERDSLDDEGPSEIEPVQSTQVTHHECQCHHTNDTDFDYQKLEQKLQGTKWRLKSETRDAELSTLRNNQVSVPPMIFEELFPHQRYGVEWILERFDQNVGGLIADDVGLGKRRQVLVAMLSLMQQGEAKRTLILSPPSLTDQWQLEARKLVKGFPRLCCSLDIVKMSKLEPNELHSRQRRPLLVITSTSITAEDCQKFELFSRSNLPWSWIVLDEGHLARSVRAQLSKLLTNRKVCSDETFRLALTSQFQYPNKEFHNLLGWATAGKTLTVTNDEVLEAKQTEECQKENKKREASAIEQLLSGWKSHILQRSKTEILPKKEEFIVCAMQSESQRAHSEQLLASKSVETTGGKGLALAMMTRLRLICCHPFFAKDVGLQSDKMRAVEEFLEETSAEELVEDSCKLKLCSDLITQKFIPEGRKTVIFSEFQSHLDFFRCVLLSHGVKVTQCDGRMQETERQNIVECFNKDNSHYHVMLVSIKAGGLSLPMTGADRVILLGPSWNPAVDARAIARVHRIGQTRSVEIYRLIVAGSIEEKMLHKQIHRQAHACFNAPMSVWSCIEEENTVENLTLSEDGICETTDLLPTAAEIVAGNRHKLLLEHPSLVSLFHLSEEYSNLTETTDQKVIHADNADSDTNMNPTKRICMDFTDLEGVDCNTPQIKQCFLQMGKESNQEVPYCVNQQLSPDYQVGTEVMECFHGHGWFHGEVVAIEGGRTITIRYEDDEEETLHMPQQQNQLDKMITNKRTLRYVVGTPVKKGSIDYGYLAGKIVSMEEDRYRVAYEKGGIEEFLFVDLDPLHAIVAEGMHQVGV